MNSGHEVGSSPISCHIHLGDYRNEFDAHVQGLNLACRWRNEVQWGCQDDVRVVKPAYSLVL